MFYNTHYHQYITTVWF